MVKIRRAKKEDIPQMVDFGEGFWKQTSYYRKNKIAYNKPHIIEMVEVLLDLGIVQVAYDDTRVVGIILMVVGPVPYDPRTKVATELVYYVDPEYRDTGLGKRLLSQAEHVAKQLGCSIVSMIHLASVSPEKAERVYKSMGYEKTETLFSKEL